ncbi:MAG: tetratricopeptide repeat protein [bacterium]
MHHSTLTKKILLAPIIHAVRKSDTFCILTQIRNVIYEFSGLVSGFICLLLIVSSPDILLSQNSAADWLNIGIKAQSLDEKIQAFNNAIKFDPTYVEAYYYLGLAYKMKGEYREAEYTLNKGYFINLNALNNENKTRILYELGTIYSSLGKIEEARDALLGAKGLTDDKTLRARLCYELGQIYIKEGKFDKALLELNECEALLPQSATMIERAITIAHEKKSINDKYNTAISMLISERFEEAIKLFNEVIKLDPNFKQAQQKLQEAEIALNQNNRYKKLNSLYDQATLKVQNRLINDAVKLFKQIVNIEPNFKDSNAQLQYLLKRLDKMSRDQKVERYYNVGVAAIQRRNWKRALIALQKANKIDGHYKDISSLIQQIKTALEREDKKKAKLYNQGIALMESENWALALSTFEKLKKLDANYSNLENQIQSVKKALEKAKNNNDSAIEKFYQEGLFALQNGDWLQAVIAFEKVQLLNPEYKNIQNNMADARFNLTKSNLSQIQPVRHKSSNTILMIGFTISAFVLPIFGVLVFSPTTRARLYLLQGKYDKAAYIFEKMLIKNSGRIKLYPLLANIYLLENRRDDRALKVFEMILRLNLYTKKKEEINSIMANHYLTQGRTDANAIKILERELSAKLKNLQSD